MTAQTSQKNQTLAPGTNLDDRYRIIRVLGMGGFGITYEAENERIHIHVAIKELFSASYMTRGDDGITVTVLSSSEEEYTRNSEKLERDRAAFLREAGIIGTFEKEPGIVHVIDYFEANGTVYIVMEYLDGVTLRDYQMVHGVFKPDEIFKKMLPVMASLQRIHSAGVLHRDISPDNIMVMKDGTLRLMDFGSAAVRHSAEEETSDLTPVKDGYTPIEQYAVKNANASSPEEDRQGSWTDVYSLAASIYTCITGIVPPAAVLRSTYDELKTPSELMIPMRPRLEKILLKAMAVKPEDRIRNMADFRESVMASIPGQERGNGKKKKIFRISIYIAAAAAVISFFIYSRSHEAEIKFHGKETETLLVSPPDDMSANDYLNNTKILKKRLDVLVGSNNYIWKDSENGAEIIFPAEKLGGEDPEEVAKRYLASSWKMGFASYYDVSDENSIWTYRADTGICLHEGDLMDLKLKNDGISRQADLPENGSDKADSSGTGSRSEDAIYEGKISGDVLKKLKNINGDCFICESDPYISPVLNQERDLTNVESGTQEIDLSGVPEALKNLVLYEISSEPLTGSLVCDAVQMVEWEDTENITETGLYEKDAEEIDADPVILKYVNDYDWKTLSNGEWERSAAVLRGRLDTLKKPYAVGADAEDTNIIYIKMNKDDIYSSVAEILPYNSVAVTSGDGSGKETAPWISEELNILSSGSDEDMAAADEVRKLTEIMQNRELSSDYIILSGIYEEYDASHTGREVSLTRGEFAYHRMFEKFRENGEAQHGTTETYVMTPFQRFLTVRFSGLGEDELAEKAVSLTKQIVEGTSEDMWTHNGGQLNFFFSEGGEFGSSIYEVIRKPTDTSENNVSARPMCTFTIESWKEDSLDSELRKKLNADPAFDGKVKDLRELHYNTLLK